MSESIVWRTAGTAGWPDRRSSHQHSQALLCQVPRHLLSSAEATQQYVVASITSAAGSGCGYVATISLTTACGALRVRRH